STASTGSRVSTVSREENVFVIVQYGLRTYLPPDMSWLGMVLQIYVHKYIQGGVGSRSRAGYTDNVTQGIQNLAMSLCPDLGTKGSVDHESVNEKSLEKDKGVLIEYMKTYLGSSSFVWQRRRAIYLVATGSVTLGSPYGATHRSLRSSESHCSGLIIPMSEVEQPRSRWSRLDPRMSPLSSLGVVTVLFCDGSFIRWEKLWLGRRYCGIRELGISDLRL
ncbi:hypothetical protein Tco_1021967, partial [Tanacetum coccineum]